MDKVVTVNFPEKEFHRVVNLLQLLVVGGITLNARGNAIPTADELEEPFHTMLRAGFAAK